MELSSAQVAEFKENGFLLLRGFLDKNNCNLIRDIAKIHMQYKVEPIETEYEYIGIENEEYKQSVRRIRQVYDRDIVFKNWMLNREIRPILEQVLDEKPVIVKAHHNSIMTKRAKTSTHTEWHRDRRYWSYDSDNLVSVWLALQDENQENGVLEFIPGSHKMKLKPEQFDEKDFFMSDYEGNLELISKKVSFNLEAGDIVLFHCELLHRANANKSDKDKISFVYTVKGKSVNALPNSRSSSFGEVEL